jgi:hypothetical protein
MIAQATQQQGIGRDQLTIHADRGSAMRSKPVAFLLADLGITKTHSRPSTSSDNPYSEAHFKTMKYRSGFPDRFGSILEARSFCRDFFAWYNQEHRHSGIGLLSPAVVHSGRAEAVHAERARVLAAAHEQRPERFVRGLPRPPELPKAAWINPPKKVQIPAHAEEVSSNDLHLPRRTSALRTCAYHSDRQLPIPLSDAEVPFDSTSATSGTYMPMLVLWPLLPDGAAESEEGPISRDQPGIPGKLRMPSSLSAVSPSRRSGGRCSVQVRNASLGFDAIGSPWFDPSTGQGLVHC